MWKGGAGKRCVERSETRRESRARDLRTVVRGRVVEESEKRWKSKMVRLRERASLEATVMARWK